MRKIEICSPTLTGVRAVISGFGARLLELHVPAGGGSVDVVNGPVDEEDVLADPFYMGASVGRCANRISKAKYSYQGEDFQLTANKGENHIHGGGGLHKKVWKIVESDENSVTLSIESPSGEDGYPGNVRIEVRYSISDESTLLVEYSASTDKATPMNIVQHTYWNLTGDHTKSIKDHTLQSDDIEGYLESDDEMIPSGKVIPTKGTPFDFNKEVALNLGLEGGDTAIERANGYDHCLVFGSELYDGLKPAVTLKEPQSGRSMVVRTNMPAMQLYTGNFLDASSNGKQGEIAYRTGVCLETQHYIDAVNQSSFPSVILQQGELYQHLIEYKFSIGDE